MVFFLSLSFTPKVKGHGLGFSFRLCTVLWYFEGTNLPEEGRDGGNVGMARWIEGPAAIRADPGHGSRHVVDQ